jgi:hypothetical protein
VFIRFLGYPGVCVYQIFEISRGRRLSDLWDIQGSVFIRFLEYPAVGVYQIFGISRGPYLSDFWDIQGSALIISLGYPGVRVYLILSFVFPTGVVKYKKKSVAHSSSASCFTTAGKNTCTMQFIFTQQSLKHTHTHTHTHYI